MSSLWSSLRAMVVTAPVFITFRDYIASIYYLEGASMVPTFNPYPDEAADWVLANRWAAHRFHVDRGDVIVLQSPVEPHRKVIKRLIALEGDTISLPGQSPNTLTIPLGHMWIEGDNRRVSNDSLSRYGPIPIALLEARVSSVVWPPSRWGWVENKPPSTDRLLRLRQVGDKAPAMRSYATHDMSDPALLGGKGRGDDGQRRSWFGK